MRKWLIRHCSLARANRDVATMRRGDLINASPLFAGEASQIYKPGDAAVFKLRLTSSRGAFRSAIELPLAPRPCGADST